jgi:hypothetical protein
MNRRARALKSPFFSALLGGVVVGLFGWIAIAAGWIDAKDNDTTTAVSAPLSAPVSDHSDSGSANTVNEIYKSDGQGVAFIEANPRPSTRSVKAKAAGSRRAPAL